ncbi:MAG: hypothetical protein KAH93_02795 [Candidatus Aenigmarchaeota archaeon]|nr:hypothetical protein [Candidatus Aenigmarchaeota archaeon]
MKMKNERFKKEEKIVEGKTVVVGRFKLTFMFKVLAACHSAGGEIVGYGSVEPVEVKVDDLDKKKKEGRRISFVFPVL